MSQISTEKIKKLQFINKRRNSHILQENSSELSVEVRDLISMGQCSAQMSVRLLTVHGVLYLLQSLSADEAQPFMSIIVDHVNNELDYAYDTATADSPLAYRY